MKILNKTWQAGLIVLLLITTAPDKTKAQEEGGYISDQEFYDELSPYGTWISDPDYGNVWVPDAEEDFRPYATQGHWVYTTYGNTWVSDYPWGWAAFHYGRWRYDDYYGWEWIPGNEWAPAWVSWRTGGEYYGWAPLTPGISLSIAFGGNYNIPDNYWVCAARAYINQPNIYSYYVPGNRVYDIIHRTTIINNTYTYNNQKYISGPRRDEIQRYTSRPVTVYNINNINRPGASSINNHTVNIYRPVIQRTNDARPARVVDGNAYRQQNPNQRIGGDNRGRAIFNHNNASKLANTARNSNPDNRVVRVNNGTGAANTNPSVNRRSNPAPNIMGSGNRPDNGMTPDQRQQQQAREQQRQQGRQNRRQPVQQQAQQTDQQRQQQQAVQQNQPQQVQQTNQQREQQRQQRQQMREQQQQQAAKQQQQNDQIIRQQQAAQQLQQQQNGQVRQQQRQQAQQMQNQQQAERQQREQAREQRQQQVQQNNQQRQQQAAQLAQQQQQNQQRQQQQQIQRQQQMQQRQQRQPRQQQPTPQPKPQEQPKS